MVAGRAGLVMTRRYPFGENVPWTTLVAPGVTVAETGAGVENPGMSEKVTWLAPEGTPTQLSPHVSERAPFSETCDGTAGLVTTRSWPLGAADGTTSKVAEEFAGIDTDRHVNA